MPKCQMVESTFLPVSSAGGDSSWISQGVACGCSQWQVISLGYLLLNTLSIFGCSRQHHNYQTQGMHLWAGQYLRGVTCEVCGMQKLETEAFYPSCQPFCLLLQLWSSLFSQDQMEVGLMAGGSVTGARLCFPNQAALVASQGGDGCHRQPPL